MRKKGKGMMQALEREPVNFCQRRELTGEGKAGGLRPLR
jgi:hypothetical protein